MKTNTNNINKNNKNIVNSSPAKNIATDTIL
jgi:hypothetical protein